MTIIKRRFLSFFLLALFFGQLLCTAPISVKGEELPFDVAAKSAILMDYETGRVLYEKNADEALPPASVTKIMTLLLAMEAVDSGVLKLDGMLTVSEYAASMGGSQVYLEAGETMSVEELIKCIVIASANDAAVTVAEAVAGSETAFVARMNERARELGMKNTNFENVTGLDDDTVNHVTSARDIAIMSRELMKHELIFKFSKVWMDTIRSGSFTLTNTNRLIRFFDGATGLKTGSTAKAGFCISATAERNGLHLIAVIMGAENRDSRNESAKTLLSYGFANYGMYISDGGTVEDITVNGGNTDKICGKYDGTKILLKLSDIKNVTEECEIFEDIKAPVEVGQKIGIKKIILNGETIGESDICSDSKVGKTSFFDMLKSILGTIF